MSRAIADPDELERFAQNLKYFNDQLRNSTSRLQAQYSKLGDTWKDQEQAKFAQEFQQTMYILQNFTKTVDSHVPFLYRKAQRIRDYLNQR